MGLSRGIRVSGHGEGRGAGHVHRSSRGNKAAEYEYSVRGQALLSMVLCQLGMNWHRFIEGRQKLAGVRRPLEGLMPVAGELASDPRGASCEVHVETRVGRTNTTRCGTRWVELGQGCGVEVKIPTDPERSLRLPGPGLSLREQWGWKPLLRTLTSGNLGSSWCSSGSGGGWGTGSGCCLGAPRHLPHSMGGMTLGQVANAHIRMGTAQLSGHIQGEVAGAISLVCGGLSHP